MCIRDRNKVRCPEERGCHDCIRRTFASYDPYKVACWSSRNEESPYQFALAAHDYAYFDCDICKTSFRMRLDKVSAGQWCPTCHIYGSSKNAENIVKKLKKLPNVTFRTEIVVTCNRRNLRWDFVVSNGDKVFHIETDGIQHFDLVKNMNIRREKNMENAKKLFSDQRTKDLLKDEYIRNKKGGLLFRVSYKQLKIIDELVDKMIKQSNNDVTGVVYMDEELYKNWGPIVYSDENEL